MKNKSFSIQIEKPCGVNLSGMTKNEVGLFCTHCEKHVIDFSKLSDDEVIALAEKFEGSFCGRFTKSQLDRVFVAIRKKPASPRLNKILAGLFTLGMLETAPASAQDQKNVAMVQVDAKQQNNNAEIVLEKNKVTSDTTQHSFRGILLDAATKQPVVLGTARIAVTSSIVETDSAGKFTLNISDSLMSDTLSIIVGGNGYSYQEIKISKKELLVERTVLLQEEIIIEGGVSFRPEPCTDKKKKKKN